MCFQSTSLILDKLWKQNNPKSHDLLRLCTARIASGAELMHNINSKSLNASDGVRNVK